YSRNGGIHGPPLIASEYQSRNNTMSRKKETIDQARRSFFGAATLTMGAAQLGLIGAEGGSARAKSPLPVGSSDAPRAFAALKQIDAGVLEVGYAEVGPSNGLPVILLHGWPYDIHAFADVASLLGSAGYRVIVPHLRGYGPTRFRSTDTLRNGQQSVVAVDIVALMDALKIPSAILAGFDWGARTANVVAALWPERCKALVSVSGYLIGSQQANRAPLPPKAELAWWYQSYFATQRGRVGYEANRHEFAN